VTQTADKQLLLSPSPHVSTGETVNTIMYSVVFALLPATAAAVYFFGLYALALVVTCVAAAVGTEYLWQRVRTKGNSAVDGSAVITGMLLALTLPPGLPIYMAALGSIVAIAIGKQIFGGLGQNIFNPALVGRAFIQAAFPVAMATWTNPLVWGAASPDAETAATPLGLMKFEGQGTSLAQLFFGNVSGSLGETSALALLIGGAFLYYKGYIEWRIPVGFVGSVALFAGLLWLIDPVGYPDPLFQVLAGGLLLGAIFMATDYVTSPFTPLGKLVFGVSAGLIVMIIRTWGGLQEGVMYAILLMNAFTPLINSYTRPAVFGKGR
jgi:Na+-translocating ferredoxin:NAD+ oxidoreductase subunit D